MRIITQDPILPTCHSPGAQNTDGEQQKEELAQLWGIPAQAQEGEPSAGDLVCVPWAWDRAHCQCYCDGQDPTF
jgi:hypothetical protein